MSHRDFLERGPGCVRPAIGFFAGPACVLGERKNGLRDVTQWWERGQSPRGRGLADAFFSLMRRTQKRAGAIV